MNVLGYCLDVSEPEVHREIERKLEVPGRFRLPPLGGPGTGIGEAMPLPAIRLRAEYYDTADLRLARHHITLRRRTGGGDSGWHLKLPHAGEATRDELQLPLSAAGNPPEPLSTLVLGVTRGAPLAPVATLSTVRRPVRLLDEEGHALAELTDDRVSVTVDGKATSRFRELEVEAAPDRTAGDLEPVMAVLIAAGASESGFASKAVRALGPRAMEPPDVASPPPVSPDAPAAAAMQALIQRHAATFLQQDLRVRRGMPDSVHQMRVAARRLRSALKVFAPLFDEPWADQLATELAWIGGELGFARDREVLERHLLSDLALMTETDTRDAVAVVERELGADQHEAVVRVSAAMKSDRYLALLDALVAAARTPQLTAAATAPAAEALPPLMRAAWKRLARSVANLRRKGPDEPWHRARIRAKHARYAAEALTPVFGKPAKRLAAQLEVVTELLGRHQDASVAAEIAAELAAGNGVGGKAGYCLGLLYDQQRDEVRRVRRKMAKVWPDIAHPRWRRWLRARK